MTDEPLAANPTPGVPALEHGSASAAAADPTLGAAPVAGEVPPQPIPVAPGFELPTARQVVGRGLQLAYDSSRDIRRASLYIGLLLLATTGPFVVLALAAIPHLSGADFTSPDALTPAAQLRILALLTPLSIAGLLASIGFVAVAIDSSLIATAILAGRAAGRPLDLRSAIGRSRQAYWRYGIASFLVGIVTGVVAGGIQLVDGRFGIGSSLGQSLIASFIAAIVVLPFCYIATAIVIGDVGGLAALGRSVTLVRARWRLALTVAAFAFVAGALQTFGLGAAIGVVGDVAQLLHAQLDLTGSGLVVAAVLAIAGIVALGSLVFTVDAVAVAPQVAAFLGLTHYSAGLDRARAAVRPARWVTIPMIVLIVLEALAAGAGLASVADAGPPPSSDPILRAIATVEGSGRASLSGDATIRNDALGDQSGGSWRQGDLELGELRLRAARDPHLRAVAGRCVTPRPARRAGRRRCRGGGRARGGPCA